MGRTHMPAIEQGHGIEMGRKEALKNEGLKVLKKLLIYAIGFMLARVVLFTSLSPMAIAFFAAVYSDKKSRFFIFLSVLGGLLTTLPLIDVIKYLLIMLVIMSVTSIVEIRGKKLELIHQSISAGIGCLLITIAVSLMQENIMDNVYISLLEAISIVSLVLIYGRGVKYILGNTKEINNEILISEAIIMGTAVAGISGITLFGIGLTEIWIFAVILVLGYKYGIGTGAVVGVISGLVLSLIGVYETNYIGIFGMIGILSGIFREIGKIGSVIGFSVGTLSLWYFLEPLNLDFVMIKSLIISVGVFTILPISREELLVAKKTKTDEEKYIDKVQNILNDKLMNFANSFHSIAETFDNISEKRLTLSQEEINKLLDDVADKVCKDCSMCNMCWQNEFYDTYRTVYSILSAVENKNVISEEDIPKVFYDKCIKSDIFITTTNRLFEIYKLNLHWENKLIENRELISQQFYGVSNIIEKLSSNICNNIKFDAELEEKIIKEMKKEKMAVKDVIVYQLHNERMEISLNVKYCNEKTKCMKDIVPLLNKITGRKMRLEEGCKYISGKKYCQVKFVENEVYRITRGVATVAKEEQEVSGDNYTFINLPKGQDIVALSDGMGSGLKASKESKAAIELLEQLLEAGFDGDTAIRMINSVLVLKSSDQIFSTLDMSVVDRYSGECEFVKIGASSSFIKRGDKVEVVKSTSLPLGMFNEVESDSTNRKLRDGDMVIMVSDGVIDTEEESLDKERWIEDAINEFDSRNPQDIADYILEMARDKVNGKVNDDMTVLVMRVWEKIS